MKINLINDTINKNDIDDLITWLQTYPTLTKGEQTLRLEKRWAEYVGTKYSVFVNSGSSANLLLLYALSQLGSDISRGKKRYNRNSKIVVPALCWATDLSPVMQLGFIPILVDCNLNDLTIDLEHLTSILENEDGIVAVISVSVLGMAPDLDKLKDITDKYCVDLIEDNCESMGTLYKNAHIGSHGIASTYSTYFGHHISTIEGGFINTSDEELYDLLLMMRSHGWDRDLTHDKQKALRQKWGVRDFDSLQTFYHPGFNLRSTDLNAKIGLRQLKKLDGHVKIRHENFNLYQEFLWKNDSLKYPGWKPTPIADSFVSNFAYPIIHPKKQMMVTDLLNAGIEIRPLICGSMGKQPMYVTEYGETILPNASIVDLYGFYVPNHPGMDISSVTYVCDVLNQYGGDSNWEY